MPDDFIKDYTQPLKNYTCFILRWLLTAAYQCIESCAAMHYVMGIHYVMHIAQLPAQNPRAYDCRTDLFCRYLLLYLITNK
jgi:hypothetical protein